MADSVASARIEQLEKELEHSRRQTALIMQVAQSSVETGGVENLVRRALEIIVRENNWIFGHFWIVREDESVVRSSQWHFGTAQLPDFREASFDGRMSKGVGLPGRIWSTGLPLLLPDLALETGLNFPRKAAALKSGLKSGFGFAIKNGPFITGVFEFFDIKPISVSHNDIPFYEKLGVHIASLIAQKESDHAARQQEELNKVVLNHAYSAFISINEASLITQWTSKASELFGWERDEVIGRPLAEVIIPERYRDAHVKGLFRYMTSGEGPVLNKRVRAPALHRNGKEIAVELMIFPIEALDMRRFGAFVVDCSQEQSAPAITLE